MKKTTPKARVPDNNDKHTRPSPQPTHPRSTATKPKIFDPVLNKAVQTALAHHQAGRLQDAESIYRQVLATTPDHPDALHFLGMIAHHVGEYASANELMRRAIRVDPNNQKYYSNYALALQEQDQLDTAIEQHRKALALDRKCAELHFNLATALQASGDLDAAIASYRAALALKRHYVEAFSNLLFVMSHHSGTTPAQYLTNARLYGQLVRQQARPYTRWPACAVQFDADPTSPLRIGFVSGDLRTHPVGFFLESVFAHLDKTRFELFAYSTSPHADDDLTRRIKPYFKAWHQLAELSDAAAARKIHADGIHILIDLAGHTAQNRLPIFAWQAAPVQVSWLGYFASTGVPGMDYLLTDAVSVPETHHEHFSESVEYLPDTRLCFAPPAVEAAIRTAAPVADKGHITFACFQKLAKITDEVLVAWGQIFAAIPTARLRVQSKQLNCARAREQLQHRLEHVGIVSTRVTLLGALPRADYFLAYNEVDIILDTFPYPGGATTCEALWMGVPTLTIAGTTMLARQGASLLSCVGLNEWIANDVDGYVNRAVSHARDEQKLTSLRSNLRSKFLASPMCDAARFARALASAFESMWQRSCDSNNKQ